MLSIYIYTMIYHLLRKQSDFQMLSQMKIKAVLIPNVSEVSSVFLRVILLQS